MRTITPLVAANRTYSCLPIVGNEQAQSACKAHSEMQKKVMQTAFCNGVGWVAQPKVSDGLWICWVYKPTYPLLLFCKVYFFELVF